MRRSTRVLAVTLALVCALSAFAAANQPPVARISAYRSSAGATAVVFDGSASTDADGQVVRHQWLFGDGTTGSGATVTHTYAQVSSFTVTLLVGDNGGMTSLATQVVNVASLPTQAAAPSGSGSASAPPAPSNAPIGNSIGMRAPEIELPGLLGGIVRLSTYLGKTVLLEFWQSTCPGCVASTPQLEALRAKYSGEGLVVFLVVLDRAPSAAISFLERGGYEDFALAWESDAARPTMLAYGVKVTPTTFLIDPTGVIRYLGHPMGLTEEFLIRWL